MNSHSKQRGQIVWLMALCAIPIALGVAYLFNSAELLSRKVRAQNAADAAALSQASWMARSMNVMSTNNVAFTQTEAVLVAGAAVQPTVVDLSQYIVREGISQVKTAAVSCPAFPVGVVACANAFRVLITLYAAAREMEDLLALVNPIGGNALNEFTEHAQAFAESNDQLAGHFAQFSADMQRSLARSNGIADPPRMMAVGWHSKSSMQPNLLSTALPVERIDALSISNGHSTLGWFWSGILAVRATGNEGTHSEFLIPVARNFKDHGFKDDEGPWVAARDDVKDPLKSAVRLAKTTGWSATNPVEEEPSYDDCWDSVSVLPTVPRWFAPCIQGGLLGLPARIYGPSSAPGQTAESYGITDILVFAKSTRTRGYVSPRRFANGLPATYGIAKARVYNATRPDLYSSDWRATLVPIVTWSGNRPVVKQELRTALIRITAGADEQSLSRYLSRINSQDLPYVLAR